MILRLSLILLQEFKNKLLDQKLLKQQELNKISKNSNKN
jgi:hypothetical protein